MNGTLYKDIYGCPSMAREIKIKKGDFTLSDKIEIIIEKVVTPVGNSAKADVPKRYIGKRVYIIVLKD